MAIISCRVLRQKQRASYGLWHDEIVERIKEARGFGDLSENSEYDAAKEEQSHNESRINEIRQILSVAKVVEPAVASLTPENHQFALAHFKNTLGATMERVKNAAATGMTNSGSTT